VNKIRKIGKRRRIMLTEAIRREIKWYNTEKKRNYGENAKK